MKPDTALEQRRVQDQLRTDIEQELVAEASAADRPEDADGASMFMDSPVPEPVLHSAAK